MTINKLPEKLRPKPSRATILSKSQFTKFTANRETKDPNKNIYMRELRKLHEVKTIESNESAVNKMKTAALGMFLGDALV
jgi:hypothetical protein